MKFAVVGSRSINDYEFIKLILDNLLSKGDSLVSGGAIGVDQLAEKYAKENGIEIKVYLPDWATWGKAAGFIRNKKIIDNCDECIVFHDGISKGAMHSKSLAEKQNKKIHYFLIKSKAYENSNKENSQDT
jgi:predicted Rossmann fold nucleotide-binding protein DprA/Smf involved in DNA uptake